jgi:tripartite-type tricarboxylate transporter receptor subunit TctC
MRMLLIPCLAASFAVGSLTPMGALAQAGNRPMPPIKIIVPSTPGGGLDIPARLIGAMVATELGTTVLVENRAGANGIIGTQEAARATDGYTFLMTSPATMVINQHVYKNLSYDPAKDFVPVTQTTSIAFILVVNATSPYKTLNDLVAAAKAKPGAIKYGSGGIGNMSHLAPELVAGATGTKMLHVPYKGEAPALVDLMGSQLDFVFATMPALLPHVKSGKLRALAVAQQKRSDAAPDVPTTAEAGWPTVIITGWTGLVAAASTSPAVVARMHDAVVKVLAMPEVRQSLIASGAEPVGSKADQFGAFMKAEAAKMGTAVKRAGITPE